MPLPWLVDPEANRAVWWELSELPLRLADGPAWVADVGGGPGSFLSGLRGKKVRLVTADVDRTALLHAVPGIRPVLASILHLPFRDASLDAVAGRAILHHVPDELDAALAEAKRAVKPGGLVLFQEPASGNPIANLARRWFPTERHDPHERPLAAEEYAAAIRRQLDILEVRPFFLLSYLMPHLVGRLRPNRRALARRLTRALYSIDRRLLAALPRLRRRAAYVSILARRQG